MREFSLELIPRSGKTQSSDINKSNRSSLHVVLMAEVGRVATCAR